MGRVLNLGYLYKHPWIVEINASDKSAILDGAEGLKLTDNSATTFSVDDVSLLLSKNVAMPNGYQVSDIASEIQGEVTADGIGVLGSAQAVTVTDRNSNALTLSVDEYEAIEDSDTQLTATYKIVDEAAAIQGKVSATAIAGASSIEVESGIVDLKLGEFRSLGSKFTDKADISITEVAKNFNTAQDVDLRNVASIEIVATADYTDLRDAIQNSGADSVNLGGQANVKVSVDQAKEVTFKGSGDSGGFQITDDATKIIGLSNSDKSGLLSDAQSVFASNATFEEAVNLTKGGGLYHQEGVSLSVDLSSTSETKAKTGFLNIAEAKAYLLTDNYSEGDDEAHGDNQAIGYRIEDTYKT